jgi:mono/diheme cytochrome c family protein
MPETESQQPLNQRPLGIAAILIGVFAVALIASTVVGDPLVTRVTVTPQPTAIMLLPTTVPPVEVAQVSMLDAERVDHGRQLYNQTCVACHGSNGIGIPGLGKPLVDSAFVNDLSDDALVAFLIVGRAANDPMNTSGIMMPARGGNGGLSDDDLYDITAYIRSLNGVPIAPPAAGEAQVVYEVRPFAALPINALDASLVPPSIGDNTGLPLSTQGIALGLPLESYLFPNDLMLAIIRGEIDPFTAGQPALTDAQIALAGQS